MNANIMNTHFFYRIQYDTKGHERSHKALLVKFFLAHSFVTEFDKKYY